MVMLEINIWRSTLRTKGISKLQISSIKYTWVVAR